MTTADLDRKRVNASREGFGSENQSKDEGEPDVEGKKEQKEGGGDLFNERKKVEGPNQSLDKIRGL